jgi:2-oxoacid:acceptor oxidoreductase delta subunit (pyruvate/2-ketoisovalerate family)
MKMISDYIVPIGPEGLHIIDTGKWRTRRPVLDEKTCKKCGLCFLYCPVFSIERKFDNSYSISYDYCKGCGICATECKFGSIRMIEEEEKQHVG